MTSGGRPRGLTPGPAVIMRARLRAAMLDP
jgi:hypothetical protein